jgi:hypothetical protein
MGMPQKHKGQYNFSWTKRQIKLGKIHLTVDTNMEPVAKVPFKVAGANAPQKTSTPL